MSKKNKNKVKHMQIACPHCPHQHLDGSVKPGVIEYGKMFYTEKYYPVVFDGAVVRPDKSTTLRQVDFNEWEIKCTKCLYKEGFREESLAYKALEEILKLGGYTKTPIITPPPKPKWELLLLRKERVNV